MQKPLVYLHIIVAEKEQTIRLLDVKLQNTYRFMATKKKLQQIINSTSQTNVLQKKTNCM